MGNPSRQWSYRRYIRDASQSYQAAWRDVGRVVSGLAPGSWPAWNPHLQSDNRLSFNTTPVATVWMYAIQTVWVTFNLARYFASVRRAWKKHGS